ncbi:ABC transporter [Paenibacillus baekrokdamisoli]|uniref:ABC transporter n=1 Tax=Paenibacillus baekrokdamisoli TaxID=1712516 RepID=A0A3G9IPZ3_9BACL|nr:ABC transporter ATP-binding protein [Paenibacillus baekrokdamisoli]MBB3069710.1 ABC-type nitrate/sulfonate/bicarbonate transport system ATPase subunit [Paenibacillus baekrokdamisoli]BBH20937.1 ABC transporter [Paenibacillus baekrokdamisoli]
MSFVLEVDGVTKSFDVPLSSKPVLSNVTFQVKEGEFVSLIGPSGSGKTTLFHLIGGLDVPNLGEIRIKGRRTIGERGNIAYMPQQASLMPWLTVAGNIELALDIAGMDRKEARIKAREWLERVGLHGEIGDSYPHVLSGGMQQRVSFLRALLSPQPLMCLDEPFGALDALTRMQMQTWLLSLWEENRRSVLFVTHSIEEALLLSDRILILSTAPATIIREVVVPFARPRRDELWSDPTFNELKREIYDQLKP